MGNFQTLPKYQDKVYAYIFYMLKNFPLKTIITVHTMGIRDIIIERNKSQAPEH